MAVLTQQRIEYPAGYVVPANEYYFESISDLLSAYKTTLYYIIDDLNFIDATKETDLPTWYEIRDLFYELMEKSEIADGTKIEKDEELQIALLIQYPGFYFNFYRLTTGEIIFDSYPYLLCEDAFRKEVERHHQLYF